MKTAVMGVLLVLVGVPAWAAEKPGGTVEPTTVPKAETIQRSILRGMYVGTFAVQAYEARTTIDAVTSGAREVNPLVGGLGDNSATILAVSLARAVAIDWGIASIAKRHRLVAIGVAVAINSAYLTIAAHNREVTDMMRGQSR